MWTGGTVPFGYSVEDKKLLVNDAEARVVREAVALLVAHRQMAFVAQRITAGYVIRVWFVARRCVASWGECL